MAGLSLFVVWLLTKVILVAIPLMTLMRLAARGVQDQEDGEDSEGVDLEGRRVPPHAQLRGLFTVRDAEGGVREVTGTPRGLRQLLLLHRLRQVMASHQGMQLQQLELQQGGGLGGAGGAENNRGSSGRPRLPNVV